MHLQRYSSKQNTFGGLADASDSGSFWDNITETVGNVVKGVTSYQLTKQQIQAGNVPPQPYVPLQLTSASGGLSPVAMIGGALLLGGAFLMLRKKR